MKRKLVVIFLLVLMQKTCFLSELFACNVQNENLKTAAADRAIAIQNAEDQCCETLSGVLKIPVEILFLDNIKDIKDLNNAIIQILKGNIPLSFKISIICSMVGRVENTHFTPSAFVQSEQIIEILSSKYYNHFYIDGYVKIFIELAKTDHYRRVLATLVKNKNWYDGFCKKMIFPSLVKDERFSLQEIRDFLKNYFFLKDMLIMHSYFSNTNQKEADELKQDCLMPLLFKYMTAVLSSYQQNKSQINLLPIKIDVLAIVIISIIEDNELPIEIKKLWLSQLIEQFGQKGVPFHYFACIIPLLNLKDGNEIFQLFFNNSLLEFLKNQKGILEKLFDKEIEKLYSQNKLHLEMGDAQKIIDTSGKIIMFDRLRTEVSNTLSKR